MDEKTPYQMALPLHVYERHDLTSFYPGDNAVIVSQILKSLNMAGSHEFFFLFGPAGCGKSHLLLSLQEELARSPAECFLLDLKIARALGPKVLDTPLPRVVLLDNVDSVAGDAGFELMLFSVFNRWYDGSAGVLVVTASSSFDQIPYARADLNTRFGSGISFELKYLNSEQCAQALQLKAQQRGLSLSSKTADFLVNHFNHDLGRLSGLLDKLEVCSLQAQHELTIPFVKQVLSSL